MITIIYTMPVKGFLRESQGCYLLRTNVTQNDPAALWKQYLQLTDAEWAFGIHKDELVILP